MSTETHRSVEMSRIGKGRYEVRNPRGGRLVLSSDEDESFKPVELMLAAAAGCSAIDVDFITSKRSEPVRFDVEMSADKIRDEHGNHLTNMVMTFHVAFPGDEGGTAAEGVVESAMKASHERLCTVSRTVEIGTPIEVRRG